jgi:hypothetical protein
MKKAREMACSFSVAWHSNRTTLRLSKVAFGVL